WRRTDVRFVPPAVSIVVLATRTLSTAWLGVLTEDLPRNVTVEIVLVSGDGDEASRPLENGGDDGWAFKTLRLPTRNAAALCNEGARVATGDVLAFLACDGVPVSGWLGWLLRTLETHSDAGIVFGKVLHSDGRLNEAGRV